MSSELEAGKAHSLDSSNAPDEGMDLNLSIENGCGAITSVDAPCEAAWPQGSLGDFIELKRGYDLPQAKRCTGDVPLISSSGHSDFHNVAMVKGPGVVTGRYGTIGQVFYVGADFWPLNTTLYVRDFKGNDPKFISYFLKTIDFLAYSDKAAVPGVNRNHLHEAIVSMPPLDIQLEIAEVLGALDDRITLLRETNATLEAMAQALFKSWFVDFDPVHANAGTRAATLPAQLQALFPDSFEDSALGRIPKGWTVSTVEDFAERVGMGPFGSNIKVETFVDKGVPVISGQHLKMSLVEDNTFNFITEEHAQRLNKSCVIAGDVIFTHAGSIGQVSLLHRNALYTSYVLSQRQFFLRCKTDLMSPEWITHYFRSPVGQHQLLANTSQVGVPSIARPVSYLRSIRLVVPPPSLTKEFSVICDSFNTKTLEIRKQISTLSTLRDTLLPRLISGQLRLPDAEAALAEVGV